MFESLSAAGEYVMGQDRLPHDVVVNSLANNNTELKALVQAPLREEEPVLVKDVSASINVACNGNTLQTVTTAHVIRVLDSMNPDFVEVEGARGNLTATQTNAGRRISAAMGGHLLKLAVATNIPMRGLIAESLKPRTLADNTVANGSIETRVNVLATMWQLARETWAPASDLIDAFEDKNIAERVARSHLAKLIGVGILERREPKRRLVGERDLHGYLYRIKQENGHIPPTETVERYLSIVLLSSVMDPDFISQGLDHLQDISQNPTYVPYLLKRSFASTGHSGKKPKKSVAANSVSQNPDFDDVTNL